MLKRVVCVLFALLGVSSFADDFDDFFSDDIFADVDIDSAVQETRVVNVTHELGGQVIVNVNSDEQNAVEKRYAGVTSTLLRVQPRIEFQPNDNVTVIGEVQWAVDGVFWLREADPWSVADIEERQYQFQVKEAAAQVRYQSWQISTGVQTVTLGLADALSLSNILHAQDLRVPGTKPLDDAVIPAWVTWVSGDLGKVRFKSGLVHRHQLNAFPVIGTDFDIGLRATLDNAGLVLEPEALAVDNMAGFASLSGVAGAFDWQLNAISQKEHVPVVELGLTPSGLAPVRLNYPRTTTLGLAGSYVTGSVLWKAEAAFVDGLQAQSIHGALPSDVVDFQQVGATVGLDYNANQLGRFVAELQVKSILDYRALNLLQTDERTLQWVLLYSKSFMRDRLTVTGQMIGFDIDASGGRIQGVGIEYDVNDRLSTELRYIDYVSGSTAFLVGADDRDRLLWSAAIRF